MSFETPLHIQKWHIEQFKRIEVLTVDAHGHHVQIFGPNGSGKTSALDSVFWLCGQLKGKAIPEPVHTDAKRATVVMDLGDYIMEKSQTPRGRPRLLITEKGAAEPVADADALLKGFLGKYSLDPLAWLNQRPQDRIQDLLFIANIQPPVDSVKKIIGDLVDGSALDARDGESGDRYLQRIGADDGLLYSGRREVNRRCTQKRDALEEQRRVVEGLGGAVKDGERQQSASGLTEKIQKLLAEKSARHEADQELADADREYAAGLKALQTREREWTEKQAEIDSLNERLKTAIKERSEMGFRLTAGKQKVAELETYALDCRDAAKKLRDPSPEIEAANKQLKEIEQTNQTRTKRRAATEQLYRLATETVHEEETHKRFDVALEAVRDLMLHWLDDVDLATIFDCPGLAAKDGELRYQGVTFEQASDAQKTGVACDIAMKERPKLRLLRIDRWETLDSNSREVVLRKASERGYQVIAAGVQDGDGLTVEIVEADGQPVDESMRFSENEEELFGASNAV